MPALEWFDSPQYGRICGFANDEVLFSKIKTGALWEPHIAARFEQYIRPGSTAVDCGANIGLHSIAMMVRQPKVDRVVAIEPHPEIFNALMANVADKPKISPLNVAVSNNVGTLLMTSLEGSMNPAGAIITDDGEYQLNTTTLDTLKLSNVSLIKIDVEGYEMQVIEGARRLIAEQHPYLIVELFPGERRACHIDRIRSLGYNFQEISDVDVLFTPH